MTPRQKGRRLSSSSGGDAVVADVGVGEADHLAGVGRVGDDLLIAGQDGVEHHLTAWPPPSGGRHQPIASPSKVVPSARTSRARRLAASPSSLRLAVDDDRLAAQDGVANPAGQRPAGVGRVAAAAGQRGRVDGPLGGGVDDAQVGGPPDGDRAAVLGR